ncbi:putative bifunctional diguanylate cyclase/phosphodiesterase [Polymorphobacter sp.]|uniref:putative bifunctional diguanylate cyclase/phosphodiesterase n=1 Tax=Polymorphobacter sp. TaxID=1909290 RepID=UPI003F720043
MRHLLTECLGALLANTSFDAGRPALILLDIDRFKAMNDALGPRTCDMLLARVAARMNTVVRDAIFVSQVGTHAFGVLLHDGRHVATTAARLLEFVGRPYAVNGRVVTLGVSLGVAMTGPDSADAQDVLHAADLALHQAQNDGGNCIRQFTPSMQERAALKQALENDFRAAISMQEIELLRVLKDQQFDLHYQPIISLADGCITGFEALLRWHHPQRGLVSPDQFIPIAEETGLINLIGEWVLLKACRDAATWPLSRNGEPPQVAVNLSALQLRDGPALLATIRHALDDSGLAAGRLEIELTEGALTGDVCQTLEDIRTLGPRLALDDFGTGYSSLSRLHRYPFTRLKIDQSFVAEVASSDDRQVVRPVEWIVRAMASLGKGLGLETTVEGIETPHQLDIARRAGCTHAQGFIYSAAVPATAVAGLMATLERTFEQADGTDDTALHAHLFQPKCP